jgi:hypothetical protein
MSLVLVLLLLPRNLPPPPPSPVLSFMEMQRNHASLHALAFPTIDAHALPLQEVDEHAQPLIAQISNTDPQGIDPC